MEEIVLSDYRMLNAVKLGFSNNRSLARLIRRDVNERIGHNASLEAIAVAIQRIGMRARECESGQYADILSDSHLRLRDGIRLYYLKAGAKFNEPTYESIIDANRGFYVKIQGIGSVTILVDDESARKMRMRQEDVLSKKGALSAIIITSPKNIVETPGVIAHLMAALGGSRINVVEVTSSYDTTFIIVEEKDSLKAVEAVRRIISRTKSISAVSPP